MSAPGKVADATEQTWELRSMATVQARSVNWLWTNWIPLGKISTLTGKPKVGKGLLYSQLIADVTHGRLKGDIEGQPRNAVIITTEDDPGDTLKPRLDAAGADSTRIHYIHVGEDGLAAPPRFPYDGPRLAALLEEVGEVALIVIDPLIEFIDGKVDTHKSQVLRQALASVQPIAGERTAVLAVVHLNKNQSTDVMHRMEAGGAFHQVSRGGMILGEDPDAPRGDPGRILVATPSNLTFLPPALRLEIQGAEVPGQGGETITTAKIAWGDPVDGYTADDLLRPRRDEEEGNPDPASALDEAIEFLQEELAKGPQLVKSIFANARGQGISGGTLQRARRELAIESRKTSQTGPWEWSIPRCSGPDDHLGNEQDDHLGKTPASTGDQGVAVAQGVQPSETSTLGSRRPLAAVLARRVEDQAAGRCTATLFEPDDVGDPLAEVLLTGYGEER